MNTLPIKGEQFPATLDNCLYYIDYLFSNTRNQYGPNKRAIEQIFSIRVDSALEKMPESHRAEALRLALSKGYKEREVRLRRSNH